MTCSVIILNWNGEAILRRYLPSVIQHTQGDGVEIVVADNGSTDASLDFLHTQSVRVIELGNNYGFAEGYNRAIAMVDSEYVVLLNSDVEVTAGWLGTLLSYMRAHEHVAAVQPKVLSWQSKQDALASGTTKVCFEHAGAAGGMIDCLGYPYCRGRFLTHVEIDTGQYDKPVPIFWASGACLMIRRNVYIQQGGLDATFFAHQEEIDLCWRFRARGRRILCVPQSTVYHVGGATLDKSNPRKTFLNFRNNLLMLYKNLPENELCLVMAVRAILDYVAAFKFLLAGNTGDFKAVLSARKEYKRMRGSYTGVRKENIKETVVHKPSGRGSFMLLWQYYVCRRKYFNQLKR